MSVEYDEFSYLDAETLNLTLPSQPEISALLENIFEPELIQILEFEQFFPQYVVVQPNNRERPPSIHRSYPETNFLHVDTGLHLRGKKENYGKIFRLFLCNLIQRRYRCLLSLQALGKVNEAECEIYPLFHMGKMYESALRHWQTLGYQTLAFLHNGRKHLKDTVSDLANGFSHRMISKCMRPAILACYFVGVDMVAIYTTRYVNVKNRIQHCVFAKSPLGGS